MNTSNDSPNFSSKSKTFRKISSIHPDKKDLKNLAVDINLLYIKDDKFIGSFEHEGGIVVDRSYVDHTPQRRTYWTKVSSKRKNPKGQLIILHGFTHSSNFIEVGPSH